MVPFRKPSFWPSILNFQCYLLKLEKMPTLQHQFPGEAKVYGREGLHIAQAQWRIGGVCGSNFVDQKLEIPKRSKHNWITNA